MVLTVVMISRVICECYDVVKLQERKVSEIIIDKNKKNKKIKIILKKLNDPIQINGSRM